MHKILFVVISFVGPAAFGISDSISGDWIDIDGNLVWSAGKIITAIIAIVYVLILICCTIRDFYLEKRRSNLEEKCSLQ